MYKLTSLLCAVGILSTSVLALPTVQTRVDSSGIDITDLRVHWVEDGNTTITFTIQDQAPLANEPGPVNGTWPTVADASGKAFVVPKAYRVSVDAWKSYNDFRLHISHSYRDPSVGQPDYVTVFANADIAEPGQIDCEEGDGDVVEYTCTQPSGTVIRAPITSMIAKK